MTDDYLNRDFEHMLDGWRTMQQEVIRLREENEKLREALKLAQRFIENTESEFGFELDCGIAIRAAAAALKEMGDE